MKNNIDYDSILYNSDDDSYEDISKIYEINYNDDLIIEIKNVHSAHPKRIVTVVPRKNHHMQTRSKIKKY